jgi:hypothetical protein
VVFGFLLVLGLSTAAYAGPGSVVIKTDGDITARFGAQVRMIPTYEQDWDFGIHQKTGATANLQHLNEAGFVNRSYIRSEDRLYFNFAKGDIWDVYMALEWDDVLSARTVDRSRESQGDFASFGIERLNASIKLPWIFSRLNAGWDVYSVDVDLGALIYTDDDPGFYLQGGVANLDWKLGYHKKVESNRRIVANRNAASNVVNGGGDNDRDILSARVNYTLMKETQVGLIFAWNREGVRGGEGQTNEPPACVGPACPEVDTFYIGPLVKASVAGFKFTGQFSHSWGDARKTGVTKVGAVAGTPGSADYEIDSNAFFADLAYDLTPWTGFRFIPHVGVWWLQGDNNPSDSKLEGYVGAVSMPRFTPSFGGENTIIADTNLVYGSILYSFFPDFNKGNQNANLGVGGIVGTGRGDNPGILIVGGGITVDPIKAVTYRTNIMYLRYDENFCIANVNAAGVCTATASGAPNLITDRDAGVEWDNEVSWWLDKNFVLKGQFSFLFPGDGIRQITRALINNNAINNGNGVDETAMRLALELLWNF